MVQGFSNSFIFEHVMPVTSLLGYQTKQKVAARSGERNENVFFFFFFVFFFVCFFYINTARLFESVTETNIQVKRSRRR